MAWKQVKNWASTTIPGALTDVATSITVADATLLPAAEFWAVVWNAGEGGPDADPDHEIVLVTEVTGNVLTVTRGQQGTTAKAHDAGCSIANVITAGDKEELTAAIDAHGHALDDLSDVDTTGVADNNVLTYDLATQTWGPAAVAGGGDVTGPAGATDGNLAAFDGVTGKLLKDSSSKPADFATAAHTHAQLHDRAHAMASSSDHSDWPSGLDVTELGYVNGVTGAIQTQLDARVSGPAGAVVDSNLAGWDTTTGRLLKDSGSKASDFAAAAHAHTGTYEPANANIQSHISSTSNPHSVSAAQLSLGTTDNVSFGDVLSSRNTTLSGSNYTNSTTTLSTAYQVDLTEGGTYNFRAVVHATIKSTEGIKICIGASSITSIIYQIVIRNASTGAVLAAGRKTAVGSVIYYTGADCDVVIEMEGSTVINKASTLGVRAAQQATGANAVTILIGSSLCCWRTA